MRSSRGNNVEAEEEVPWKQINERDVKRSDKSSYNHKFQKRNFYDVKYVEQKKKKNKRKESLISICPIL